MTADEWDCVRDCQTAYKAIDPHRYDRKLRLFAVACLRRSWTYLPSCRHHGIVRASERFADDPTLSGELESAVEALQVLRWEPITVAVRDAAAAWSASYADSHSRYFVAVDRLADIRTDDRGPFARPILRAEARWHEQFAHLQLLRDIVGNPFRPVAFDPGWRTGTAVALARQVYDARDFDLLPVLADALEEAGCDAAELLAHCRGPGPHVRGCWAVDLVLGKT